MLAAVLIIMIHILPPALLLLSFHYIRLFIKERGKPFMQRFSTGIMVPILWWATFDSCKSLGVYLNTGVLPDLHPERIPWILGIYGVFIVIAIIWHFVRKRLKRYPRRSYGSRYHNYR